MRKLHPPVSWEPLDALRDFAHVLGEVNIDSVVMAIDLVANPGGKFDLPLKIATYMG